MKEFKNFIIVGEGGLESNPGGKLPAWLTKGLKVLGNPYLANIGAFIGLAQEAEERREYWTDRFSAE